MCMYKNVKHLRAYICLCVCVWEQCILMKNMCVRKCMNVHGLWVCVSEWMYEVSLIFFCFDSCCHFSLLFFFPSLQNNALVETGGRSSDIIVINVCCYGSTGRNCLVRLHICHFILPPGKKRKTMQLPDSKYWKLTFFHEWDKWG